jgi:nucleotide-binding universal stress UspA family protein
VTATIGVLADSGDHGRAILRRAGEEQRRRGTIPPGGPVVLGVAPRTTQDTVTLAFSEAADRRVGLIAVRAWDDPRVDLGLQRPDRIAAWDRAEAHARTELELALAAGRAAHPGVPVTSMVVQDSPSDLLLAFSTRAQLLVIGRSERGAAAGSPVGLLLRAAGCPVLVVPSGRPAPRAGALGTAPPLRGPSRDRAREGGLPAP